jgi:hypothetical protein
MISPQTNFCSKSELARPSFVNIEEKIKELECEGSSLNNTGRLGCFGPLTDGPSSDLVRSTSEVPNQLLVTISLASDIL